MKIRYRVGRPSMPKPSIKKVRSLIKALDKAREENPEWFDVPEEAEVGEIREGDEDDEE